MKKYIIEKYSVVESEDDFLLIIEEKEIEEFFGELTVPVEKILKYKNKKYFLIKSGKLKFKNISKKTIPVIILKENGNKEVMEFNFC